MSSLRAGMMVKLKPYANDDHETTRRPPYVNGFPTGWG